MKKLIINSIMVVLITPLVLLTSYTFAYEVLIIKSEVETVETIKPIETKEEIKVVSKPIEPQQTNLICDGCAQPKENLKQVKLPDIQQPVLLCEECQLKFKEVNND